MIVTKDGEKIFVEIVEMVGGVIGWSTVWHLVQREDRGSALALKCFKSLHRGLDQSHV